MFKEQTLPCVEEQKYLGITFDRRMTWKKQIENAESKARKRLSIMRKLAGTKWGATEKILSRVYKGAVRPHLEYGSNSFLTAASTHQNSLEKIQNQGLRIITGAMKSTPINKMQSITGTPSLRTRWENKALTHLTKIRAMTDHPMHERAKELEPSRLKRSSFMSQSKMLQRTIADKLPKEIKLISNSCQPPEIIRSSDITICTSVPQLNSKEDKENAVKRSLSLEMLERKYPIEAWTRVYTDGSAVDAIKNGGAGIVIQEDDVVLTLAVPVGLHCSNYKAETEALKIAARTIETNTDQSKQIVFLTDALSVLQTLQAGGHLELRRLLENIKSHRTVLQWIPAHCGIPGNEEADSLAKKGSEKEQTDVSATYDEVKTILKSLHAQPRPNDNYFNLSRPDQVTIFRLRTGHNRLRKHMCQRFGLTSTPLCSCNMEEQDAAHVLQRCQLHESLRKEIWPITTPIEKKLYGTLEDLKKTALFIHKSGLQV